MSSGSTDYITDALLPFRKRARDYHGKSHADQEKYSIHAVGGKCFVE